MKEYSVKYYRFSRSKVVHVGAETWGKRRWMWCGLAGYENPQEKNLLQKVENPPYSIICKNCLKCIRGQDVPKERQ